MVRGVTIEMIVARSLREGSIVGGWGMGWRSIVGVVYTWVFAMC